MGKAWFGFRKEPLRRWESKSVAAAVVGLSLGMLARTLVHRWDHPTFQSSWEDQAVAAGMLLGLVAGLRIPHQFALLWAGWLWRRFLRWGGPSDSGPSMLGGQTGVDRSRLWSLMSFVFLAAGLGTACLPWTARLASVVLEWLDSQFVWSTPAVLPVIVLVSLFTALPATGPLGMATGLLLRLDRMVDRPGTRVSAWLLLGVVAGIELAGWNRLNGWQAEITVLAASLPLFLCSGAGALLGGRRIPRKRGSEPLTDELDLADLSDLHPTLLRAALIAASAGAAGLILTAGGTPDGKVSSTALVMGQHGTSWALTLLSMGLIAGSFLVDRAARSVALFGVLSVAAGVSVGGGWLIARYLGSWGQALATAGSAIGLIGLGMALTVGRTALLERSCSRAAAAVKELSRGLMAGALMAAIVVPITTVVCDPPFALPLFVLPAAVLGARLMLGDDTGIWTQRPRPQARPLRSSLAIRS